MHVRRVIYIHMIAIHGDVYVLTIIQYADTGNR